MAKQTQRSKKTRPTDGEPRPTDEQGFGSPAVAIGAGKPGKAPSARWPTVGQAAKLAGVSRQAIYQWAETGEIETTVVDGLKRFNPEDVAALTTDETKVRRDLVQTLAEETQRLLRLTTEPAQKLLAMFETLIDKQNKRIGELEEHHLAVLKQYEDALSLRHERDLELFVVKRQQERVDEGAATLKEWIPKIALQAIGRVKVEKLIGSLTDEQLEVLLESDTIDRQQFELMGEIRDQARKRAAAATAAAEGGHKSSQASTAPDDKTSEVGEPEKPATKE